MRQFERMVARKVAEAVSAEMIQRMSGQRLNRKTRRYMGRVYGNAAYRVLHDIKGGNGYHSHNPHASVVGYVAAETKKYIEQLLNPPVENIELPPLPEILDGKETLPETP